MKQWYEALFTNYANKYEDESFTKGTITEVDFIEKEINYNKEIKILDIGCGTGRHAIELAKRGYKVRGIDLSENMLEKAREKAAKAKVKVEFKKADARNFCYESEFDLAIMLCEGGFSLMETDMMNFQILKNGVSSIKPGGKFIFTCLNALYPLFHSVKHLIESDSEHNYDGSFDLMSFREISVFQTKDDNNKALKLNCNERYYAPSEISFMLELLNIEKHEIFGCDIGVFSRDNKISTTNYEMLVVAEKSTL